jgi:hypothetical protein
MNISCRGKITISTTTKTTRPSSSDDAAPEDKSTGEMVNMIRTYELMFVQEDFEPGQSFFSVTFNKTLVQNGNIPSQLQQQQHHQRRPSLTAESPLHETAGTPQLHHATLHHQDKGLMLSGHYACLRSSDLGTVRVHLPPGILTGELSPQFITGSSGTADTTSSPFRRKHSAAHLLSVDPSALPSLIPGDELFARAQPTSASAGQASFSADPASRDQFFASLLDANGMG